jgi:hypothetical protein
MSRSNNQDPFLAHTHFVTGEIPSSLGKLEKLEHLYLQDNALSGKTNVFDIASDVPCVTLYVQVQYLRICPSFSP